MLRVTINEDFVPRDMTADFLRGVLDEKRSSDPAIYQHWFELQRHHRESGMEPYEAALWAWGEARILRGVFGREIVDSYYQEEEEIRRWA